MKRYFYLASSLLIVFIIYGLYVGHAKQQNDYKGRLEVYLGGACNGLIKMDFGWHASDVDVEKSDKNIFAGSSTVFDGNNNVMYSRVEGRSFIYFDDMAPQEITCQAIISPLANKSYRIEDDTEISFIFIGPKYLPRGFISKYGDTKLVLTVQQVDDLFGLSILNVKDKPEFQFYGLF